MEKGRKFGMTVGQRLTAAIVMSNGALALMATRSVAGVPGWWLGAVAALAMAGFLYGTRPERWDRMRRIRL